MTKNIYLAVLLHPTRPPRCYQSINQQNIRDKAELVNYKLPFYEHQQERQKHIKTDLMQLLNVIHFDAEKAGYPYTCIWFDDVATADAELLRKFIIHLQRGTFTVAGLGHWTLSAIPYPTRVWLHKTNKAHAVIAESTTCTWSDGDLCWQKENDFKPVIVAAAYNHWLPTQIDCTHWQYVLEEVDEDGSHHIDKTCTLNLTNQRLEYHGMLK